MSYTIEVILWDEHGSNLGSLVHQFLRDDPYLAESARLRAGSMAWVLVDKVVNQ